MGVFDWKGECKSLKNFLRKSDEAFKTSIATEVSAARLTLESFFDAEHEGCFVRAKTCSPNGEETKASQRSRVVEPKNDNVTIRSLVDQNECEMYQPKQMCAVSRQQFARLDK